MLTHCFDPCTSHLKQVPISPHNKTSERKLNVKKPKDDDWSQNGRSNVSMMSSIPLINSAVKTLNSEATLYMTPAHHNQTINVTNFIN